MFALIRIALRNVLRNRRRSLITLFAIFLALTVMVGVRGVLNGLQASIKEAVIYGMTGAVQVHKKGYLASMQGGLELDIPADEAFVARIKKVPHVTAAAARIPFGGMVNAHDDTVFALFQAFDPVYEVKVCPRRFERMSSGRILSASSPTGSDLSEGLLQRLDVKLGDTVALLTNDHDGVLNAAEVKADGGFATVGLNAQEKKVALLPLPVAQELLRMPGRATEIAVGIDDMRNLEQVKADLQKELGPDYEVSTWHDVASFVDEIIKGQNGALSIIFFIFAFVALLGIANTMLMSVRERTREIGTMMAVGVRRRQILSLFLVEAALIGFAGASLGLYYGGTFVAYWGTKGMSIRMAGQSANLLINPFITPAFCAQVFIGAALGAALAALLPALLASRLRPVEELATNG